MGSPGVVIASKFVMPGSDEYKDFVNYINRDEAKYKKNLVYDSKGGFSHYYSYMDYMGDDTKQGLLFTQDRDCISPEEKNKLQQQFEMAQQNGSPMWQDVISFDNSFLQKYGVLDEAGNVNEVKLRAVVRDAVNVMLEDEQMLDSAVWTAAIHYNTDNIHVHVATVEPFPTRQKSRVRVKNSESKKWEWQLQYRGKRKNGSISKMKSKVVNSICDRSTQLERIDQLIRGSRQRKEEQHIEFAYYRKTKKLFEKAMSRLPSDRRQWRYGYNSIYEARPYIDEMVETYLDTFYKKEMNELNELLDNESELLKTLYGEGSQYKDYKKNKLDDLKKRMGNAVLNEMRDYQKNMDTLRRRNYPKKNTAQYRVQHAYLLNRSINELNYRLRKTYEEYETERNIEEFDRMLDGYDYER